MNNDCCPRRPPPDTQSVIIHVDLDCFYAQVEHKRNSVPRDVPLAVQQWGSLIAVNYKAREFGVSRFHTAADAKKLCPGIVICHVDTFLVEDGSLHESTSRQGPVNKNTEKASLEPYRVESGKIFNIFTSLDCTCEKAGIDECFLDVTDLCRRRLDSRNASNPLRYHGALIGQNTEEEEPLPETRYDMMLAVGSEIALELRERIFKELGYTTSAGVAHNKFIAKLGSSQHKPNKQSITRSSHVGCLLESLDVKSIRSLGGKLGTELNSVGIIKTRDVCTIGLDTLAAHVGGLTRATRVWNLCHGVDDEKVVDRSRPQSLNAVKNITPAVKDIGGLELWVDVLVKELITRMKNDHELYQREPQKVTVAYRSKATGKNRSKVTAMPMTFHMASLDDRFSTVKATVMRMLRSMESADIFPCSLLALAADNFMNLVDPSGGQKQTRLQFSTPVAPARPSATSSTHELSLPKTNLGEDPPETGFDNLELPSPPSKKGSAAPTVPIPQEQEPETFVCPNCKRVAPFSDFELHTKCQPNQPIRPTSSAHSSGGQAGRGGKRKRPATGSASIASFFGRS